MKDRTKLLFNYFLYNKKYNELRLDDYLSKDKQQRHVNKAKNACIISALLILIIAFTYLLFKDGISALVFALYAITLIMSYFLIKKTNSNKITNIIEVILFLLLIIYIVYFRHYFGYELVLIIVVPMFAFILFSLKESIFLEILLLILVIFFSFVVAKFGFFNKISIYEYNNNFVIFVVLSYLVNSMMATYNYLTIDYEDKKAVLNMYTDSLTGLTNRTYYNAVIDSVRKEGIHKNEFTVVSLDVNGLKMINDTYGHIYGDIVIKATARIIESAFNDANIVSRIGGDEFVVFCAYEKEEFNKRIQMLEDEASKWHDDTIGSLSIAKGWACFSEHPYTNPEKLYSIADEEMYKNKATYYVQNDRRKNVDRRHTS